MTGPENVKSYSDFQNLRLGGVPATDTGVIGNPSAISILQSQILESGFPAWFSTLAPDAQSWVLGIAMTAATIIPEIASLEVEAGLTTYTSSTATAPASTSASTTSHSGSTTITTTKATTTSQVITTTQTSSPASPSSSSSKAGAAPTKVIAGILGAVGFLGLAVAL
jgi:carbohydrate-binding DOMON domain-containing protein